MGDVVSILSKGYDGFDRMMSHVEDVVITGVETAAAEFECHDPALRFILLLKCVVDHKLDHVRAGVSPEVVAFIDESLTMLPAIVESLCHRHKGAPS